MLSVNSLLVMNLIDYIRSDLKAFRNKTARTNLAALSDIGMIQLLLFRFLRSWETSRVPYGLIGHILELVLQHLLDYYMPASVDLGSECIVFHGKGNIINGRVRIGNRCVIYSRVCLGERYPGDGVPVIGHQCVIGTGACVFGPVLIPDNTLIPANCVLTPKNYKSVLKI